MCLIENYLTEETHMRRREFLADASLASALMLVGGCSTVEENIESIADAVERSKKTALQI